VSSLADRTVLVTGANSGLGLATAIELARRGFATVGSVRSEAKAAIVASAAAQAGVTIDTVLLDVRDAERGRHVVDEVRPWGLVNNAGYAVTGAIEDVGDDEAEAVMQTLVMAPMRLARLALPAMREQGTGCIVNVSSIAGLTTAPFVGWYTGAKHALEALTDALRVEVAGGGIRVVLVEPGGFKTGIWEDFHSDVAKRAGSRFDAAYRRSLQGLRLSGPIMGSPEQVGKVIARAMTARVARARYLVGIDAYALNVLQQMTPTVIRDRATRIGLGI
jgi:NAD(P)-dependent dehydrogenase (short-subunit alcohol dehydrogenase family)